MNHPLQQINFLNQSNAVNIEASAGTGKTWTIERLYIKALLEGSQAYDNSLPLGVDNILVVTFTNDATNELKQRIGEQIKDTINILLYLRNSSDKSALPQDLFIDYLQQRITTVASLDKDITLLVRAVQNFDSAAIFTIHGFCNRVLQDYQFDCRISQVAELVATREQIISKLVRDYFRIHIFNNTDITSNLAEVLANLRQMFDASKNRDLSIIELVENKLPKDLFKIIDGEYLVKYDLPIEMDLARLSDSSLNDEELKIVKAAFLTAVIDYIAKHYLAEIAKSEAVSFDEIIQIVADSVKSSQILADTLYQQYPVAFIDEFQDTDDLQWQLFSRIYLLGSDVSRGNLVVVGDPKQAIYSFRGADIDAYLMARDVIANKLELTQNFRSHPNIMNFVNLLFDLTSQNCNVESSFLGNGINYTHVDARGQTTTMLPEQATIEQLLASKQINKPVYTEQVQIVSILGDKQEKSGEKLLKALTFEILTLLNADASLKGKIAILVEKNAQANELVEYLRKYGVKATELRLGNIFASRTAHSIYKVLLSCLDLAHKQNLSKALATPLFGLNLASLYAESDETNEVLEYWRQKFFNYKQIWLNQSVIALVYKLLEDIVNWHTKHNAVEKPLFSNRELANLFQLAELINKQAQKLSNQAELLHWLTDKIKNADKQLNGDIDGNNEELIRLDNDDEQIIITTQHKSKGLEYEILFCPYFKSTIKLDGDWDFNYRRPFFNSYRQDKSKYSQMITDTELGQKIVATANQETQRLNYVALTRAKSRIYIYLQNVTRQGNKYWHSSRPSKAYDLFGFNVNDNSDTSHPLFNYPEFFSNVPMKALKNRDNFSGVVVYQRSDVFLGELDRLHLNQQITANMVTKHEILSRDFTQVKKFIRQSYSGITHGSNDSLTDWFVKHEPILENVAVAKFAVLNDVKLKGATFGTLFHSLCENYPFSDEELAKHLIKQNINIQDTDYVNEFKQMLDLAFNYPLRHETTLNTLTNKLHELEFNLTIAQGVDLSIELSKLMAKYYGQEHQFTLASRTLGKVEYGFLNGFIDLFFELDGKYWVLDYKTNKLNGYAEANTTKQNEITASMSEHHYYLQYLLYLVAVKRYLEFKLELEDASDLIGGAIYYYVRGVFTLEPQPYDGIFIDEQCQQIVRELDELLKGSAVC